MATRKTTKIMKATKATKPAKETKAARKPRALKASKATPHTVGQPQLFAASGQSTPDPRSQKAQMESPASSLEARIDNIVIALRHRGITIEGETVMQSAAGQPFRIIKPAARSASQARAGKK